VIAESWQAFPPETTGVAEGNSAMLISDMSTPHAYEREPYRTELDAVITGVGEDAGRPYAVLGDTILYPEGGGQPADRGFLDQVEVLDVQKVDGELRHYLVAPVCAGPVKVRLDWSRRFDHMQQHTGQHLLTAVAQERFGWATTAFHLGEERCDIELEVPNLAPKDLARLEEAVAELIRAARPVQPQRVSLEAYQNMKVRSRGLPEGHRGEVRLIEIEGLDLNTCGGTHVRNTAELECLKLLGTEAIRGGTRLFFVVGGRARHRLEGHEKRSAALRNLLGAPDEALVHVVEAKLEQIRTAEKRVRLLEDELAAALVQALAAQPGSLVEHHFEGKDPGFLQKAARQLVTAAPSKAVFLTSTVEGGHFFVLAAGEASSLDVASRGKDIAGLLEAKGGGAKGFFQGKALSLARRAEALERLS
jgi:alanyl-tRNA synthetase